jgi:hypothetical protein
MRSKGAGVLAAAAASPEEKLTIEAPKSISLPMTPDHFFCLCEGKKIVCALAERSTCVLSNRNYTKERREKRQ